MEIWSELTTNSSKKSALNEMIGKTTDGMDNTCLKPSSNNCKEMELFVPLQFWFCRNIGLALPLIALQHHSVRINLAIRDFDDLWVSCNSDVQPKIEKMGSKIHYCPNI